MKHKNQILKLLTKGRSYSQIVRELGCSRSVISYHANRKKEITFPLPLYNWPEIQRYYDEDHSRAECMREFGFSASTWTLAVKRGRVLARPRKLPLHKVKARPALKRRILKESLLPYVCEECSLSPMWQGKELVLVLDHINGVKDDNRLENLRFLCPNCNSQMATFSGRNQKRSGLV